MEKFQCCVIIWIKLEEYVDISNREVIKSNQGFAVEAQTSGANPKKEMLSIKRLKFITSI